MKELSNGMKFKHSADESITFDLYLKGMIVYLEAEGNPHDYLVYGYSEFLNKLETKEMYEA